MSGFEWRIAKRRRPTLNACGMPRKHEKNEVFREFRGKMLPGQDDCRRPTVDVAVARGGEHNVEDLAG